jgi:hypothetical protein
VIASQPALRALLVLDIFAFLCCASLASITARGPAERALGRSAGILTEVDTYLDQRFPAIQQQAAETQAQQLTLPDFAVPVTFTPNEIQRADRDQFRALLLKRAAVVLHNDGASAFRQDGGRQAGAASAGGTIRAAIDFLRPLPHRVLVGLSIALGLLAALLAFRLVRATRGLAQLGFAITAAAFAFLALAVLAWLGLRLATAATDDYVTHQSLTLARQLAWAPIRDGLIVMVGGAAFAAAGAFFSPISRRNA